MTKQTQPIKFPTPAEHELNLPRVEVHSYNNGPVDSEPGRMTAPSRPEDHISQKVYLMPESFNALREELMNHWPNLWQAVQAAMGWNAVVFMQMMDAALDTKTGFDSAKVDAISKKYLDMLRVKRGLSELFTKGEKA